MNKWGNISGKNNKVVYAFSIPTAFNLWYFIIKNTANKRFRIEKMFVSHFMLSSVSLKQKKENRDFATSSKTIPCFDQRRTAK